MGSGASSPTKSYHVLIVGGGFGGITCARQLQKLGIRFTLVDPKDYLHINLGAIRGIVDPEFAYRTAVGFRGTFPDKDATTFIQGEVVGIDFNEKVATIKRSDGAGANTSICFTHLVIATGSVGPVVARPKATTRVGLIGEARAISEELSQSKDVLVIGGGATGVELCGEICDRYKGNKMVTLLHSGPELLPYNDVPEKVRQQALERLEKVGVKVMFNQRVQNLDSLTTEVFSRQEVTTTKGDKMVADIIFNCIGLRTNTKLTGNIFNENQINERGQVRVNPRTLEVEDTENFTVFAIGDANNYEVTKMAAHAHDQGLMVANNIRRLAHGKSPEVYKPQFKGMVVTIGKKFGVGVINGRAMPNFIVSQLKGRDLFTGMYWKKMGQKLQTAQWDLFNKPA